MNAPIIPWMGGKRRLAKFILPLFPQHQCYVEVFCGSGALFFMRNPAPVEVINDINGELVNLYRIVKHHLDEFCRQFRWALVSRQLFSWLHDTPPETLTDIQRAARFYYLQKLAFGGQVSGQNFGTATTDGPRINLLRIEEELSDAHLRLCLAVIEQLDWAECVTRYDREHTLFYRPLGDVEAHLGLAEKSEREWARFSCELDARGLNLICLHAASVEEMLVWAVA